MNIAILKLGWDQFCQHYHTSDSRLLRWTQFCLLFFLLALSMTSSSIRHYLDNNLQQLLGADLVITQYEPLTPVQNQYLTNNSTQLSLNQQLVVTLTNNELWQEVQLKVVDDNYPIQGKLKVSDVLSVESYSAEQGPMPGQIWVGSRLFTTLNLKINQKLLVGGSHLTVQKILHHEPDRLLEGHSVAMRAMINHADLLSLKNNRTDTNDRTKYRYLLSAKKANVDQLLTWAKETIPGAQLVHKSGKHPLALFWQRVENFIGLGSVLLFLMATIAIDQAGRRQIINQKRFIALCMSMGLSRWGCITISFVQWLISFTTLLLPAFVIAYLAQVLAISQMQTLFIGMEVNWDILTVLKTSFILLLLLLTFQIPQWIEIFQVSISQLFKPSKNNKNVIYRVFFSLLSISILTVYYSDNALLTGMILGSLAATIFLLMALTWFVLTLAEKSTKGNMGLIPFSFYMMKQRLLSKTMQILGVGLCATLLLFTLSLLKDFSSTMNNYMRQHDGNLIISKAQKHHIDALTIWSEETDSKIKQLKPFMFSQLVKINGKTLAEHSDTPSDSMATLLKPVRMHWTQDMPDNNMLVSGKWWQKSDKNWHNISVESEIMTDMGLNLGDKLAFNIQGKQYEFTVSSSHEFKSGNGSITFWFQVPHSARKNIIATSLYMGSMELPEQAWSSLSKLWLQHPGLRLTSVKELADSFDKTLGVIIKLVSIFSFMIILIALLVICACVQGYEADEKIKNGLLLSFGQTKSACLKLSIFEWLVTALIASGGAIFGTWIAGSLIYKSQFSLNYVPDPVWIISTLFISILVVCLVGILSNKKNLNVSIKNLLV